MQRLTWLLKLLAQAGFFFVLFAFALNNQHDVTVNFFFGTHWRGPLVLLVLAVFAAGVLLGALGTVPRWWRDRQKAAAAAPTARARTDSGGAAPLAGPAQTPRTASSEPPAPHGT